MSRRGRTACTGEKRRREAADGAAARALFDLNRIKRAHFRTSSPHIGTRVCLDGWPCRDRSASSAQRAPRFGRRAKQYYLSSPSTLASSASFVAAASASDSRYRSACSGDHTVARMGKHCVKLEPNTSPSFSSSSQNRSAPQKRQGACQARAESGDSQAAPPRPTATTHARTAPGGVRDAACGRLGRGATGFTGHDARVVVVLGKVFQKQPANTRLAQSRATREHATHACKQNETRAHLCLRVRASHLTSAISYSGLTGTCSTAWPASRTWGRPRRMCGPGGVGGRASGAVGGCGREPRLEHGGLPRCGVAAVLDGRDDEQERLLVVKRVRGDPGHGLELIGAKHGHGGRARCTRPPASTYSACADQLRLPVSVQPFLPRQSCQWPFEAPRLSGVSRHYCRFELAA